ncbi:hypothetical protein PIB30_048981 [Stylosanthes scabra]|uniref:PUM-HD domain-containing protein n=1 Tax=Stylosanthes scabra TaxID=79078 RepID=A0ABU6VF84_9FABA|nr:hypothetical protein [Stylosanthes scabra]
MVALEGGALALAKDQNGSRYLQAVIEKGNCEAVRIILEGIIENVVEVMVNPFGNHVVQKLIPVCERDQILRIILMLTNEPGRFVRVSLDVYGTRVVQKLIEKADTRQQLSLLSSSIQFCFLDLTKDTNGNHVIQCCLQCFNCGDNQFLFCAAARFCVDVATHQHGCCVLKNCLTYSMGKYQDMMVSEICKHGLLLAQDPYGNYVVQHVIELHIPDASRKLLSQFKGKFRYLSMQKFSSHVVEIFLKHVAESRSIIISELLQDSYAIGESRPTISQFGLLLQDPYANYVVQRALQVTKGALHSSLVEAISRHEDLRTSIFCKKIFSSNLLKK